MKQCCLLCSVLSVEQLVIQCILLYAYAFILAYWLRDYKWFFEVVLEFLSILQLQHRYART